jgi:hypothetical protein
MVLLHTHEIQLRPGVIADASGAPASCAPLTQRDAAEVVASVWADSVGGEDERAAAAYWYRKVNTQAPYEVLDDVPETFRVRLLRLRDALAQDPRVAAVVADD